MALIPTINQIYQGLANDLRNRLNLSEDDLKKVLDAVALSLSGQLKLTYLFLSDIQNNIFPDTADTSENGGTLDRIGLIYLNRIRRPATSGIYVVSLNGENGSTLRAGITFKSNDDSENPGKLYILDQEYNLTGLNDTVEVRALEGGNISRLENGNTLTITEPVIGVEKIVTVTGVSQIPLAEESVDDFRNAIIQSIQLEPQGGAKTDIRLWASDAQGVRLVYPYIKENEAGTVQVYVEATPEDSTDGNGTPSQSILDSVREVIEFDPDDTLPINERGRRPIQANIETVPIVPIPVDVTITGLEETSAEIETAVRNNIEAFIRNVRPFVAGADLARNRNDVLYSARIQTVVIDVLSAANFFTGFTMFVDGVEQNSFLFSRENIPFLNELNIN